MERGVIRDDLGVSKPSRISLRSIQATFYFSRTPGLLPLQKAWHSLHKIAARTR
jgi:hypothetical protein